MATRALGRRRNAVSCGKTPKMVHHFSALTLGIGGSCLVLD